MGEREEVEARDVRLCEDGKVRSADGRQFTCTGSAHLLNGAHLRCTDPSHTVPDVVILASNLTIGPAVTGDLTGQKWTCSATTHTFTDAAIAAHDERVRADERERLAGEVEAAWVDGYNAAVVQSLSIRNNLPRPPS